MSPIGGDMSEHDGNPEPAALQFDSVTHGSTADATPGVVTCLNCHAKIETEYYEVNGHAVCERCRTGIEAAFETPRGAAPFIVAALFGVGAGIAGAAIYYAVLALAHLEVGIVAILIGYMVGYAVRRGAGNRGGRRFQILAIALTYLAVAFAYAPLVIGAAEHQARTGVAAAARPSGDAAPAPNESTRPTRSVWMWLPIALGFTAILPVLVIVNSLPSGLITAIIIFIGMRQAWRMTGRPVLRIDGPYRVGSQAKPLTV
jgi:hypothetical protein